MSNKIMHLEKTINEIKGLNDQGRQTHPAGMFNQNQDLHPEKQFSTDFAWSKTFFREI